MSQLHQRRPGDAVWERLPQEHGATGVFSFYDRSTIYSLFLFYLFTKGMLAGAGVPLALLTAGSGLRLATIGVHLPGILIASLFRLVATPAIALALGLLLGLEASVLAMLVLFHSQPTSTSSYVLARQMGGDHELMAGTLTTQTLLAIVTIPAMLALFA